MVKDSLEYISLFLSAYRGTYVLIGLSGLSVALAVALSVTLLPVARLLRDLQVDEQCLASSLLASKILPQCVQMFTSPMLQLIRYQ